MKTIAVIYYPKDIKDIKDIVFKNKIFSIVPNILKKIFLHRMIPISKFIEIPELKVKVCLIEFPYHSDVGLTLPESKILKYCNRIELLLKKMEIENIVLNDGIEKHISIVNYFNSLEYISLFNGKKIFELYVEEIIKRVCKLLMISIKDLKIGIICDRLDARKEGLIKKLAFELRFLSVGSPNYKKMVEIVEKIYEDTGLVVDISDDNKNFFKECNVVINFSENAQFVNNCRLYDDSIVINYGVEIERKNCKGIIIKGLNMQPNKLSLKVYPWLGRLSFCEALVNQKDDITSSKDKKKDFELDYINKLKKLGYKISGFIGCNGDIMKEEFEYLARKYNKKRIN